MTFLVIGAMLSVVSIAVGLSAAADVRFDGIEYTILGYSFLFLAGYSDFLGCLWLVAS